MAESPADRIDNELKRIKELQCAWNKLSSNEKAAVTKSSPETSQRSFGAMPSGEWKAAADVVKPADKLCQVRDWYLL